MKGSSEEQTKSNEPSAANVSDRDIWKTLANIFSHQSFIPEGPASGCTKKAMFTRLRHSIAEEMMQEILQFRRLALTFSQHMHQRPLNEIEGCSGPRYLLDSLGFVQIEGC